MNKLFPEIVTFCTIIAKIETSFYLINKYKKHK